MSDHIVNPNAGASDATETDHAPAPAPPPDAGASRGLTKDEAEAYEEVLEREFSLTLVPAPPATEATGEMSGPGTLYGRIVAFLKTTVGTAAAHDRALEQAWKLLGDALPVLRGADEAITALRSSREAERQRAEMYVDMHRRECIDGAARLMAAFRERDEARQERDSERDRANRAEAMILGKTEQARHGLGVNLLREWSPEDRKRYGLWWAGDDAEANVLRATLDRVTVERDEARAQRDRLLCQLPVGMKHCTIVFRQCPVGHGWLTATNWADFPCPTCAIAAANARAEEAERKALMAGQDKVAAQRRADSSHRLMENERAARLKAEGERDAYKQDRDLTAHRLAAAKAEVNSVGAAWREEDRRNCQILGKALGYPEQPGGGDVVVGPNTIGSLCDESSDRIAALRARAQRLVEAGDAMVKECYDWPGLVSRWLAAKAETPRT